MNENLLEILEELPTVKEIAESFSKDKEMKVLYEWLDKLISEGKYYGVNVVENRPKNRYELEKLLNNGICHDGFFNTVSEKIIKILAEKFGDDITFSPNTNSWGFRPIVFVVKDKYNVEIYRVSNETFNYLILYVFPIYDNSYFSIIQKDDKLKEVYCKEMEESTYNEQKLKCSHLFSIKDIKDLRILLVLPYYYARRRGHVNIEDNNGKVNYMVLLSLAYLYKNLKDGKIEVPEKWDELKDSLWNRWAYFTSFWVALEFDSISGKYLDAIDKALFSRIPRDKLENFMYKALFGFYNFFIARSLFFILSDENNKKKFIKLGAKKADVERFIENYIGFWKYFFKKFPELYYRKIEKIKRKYSEDKLSIDLDELVEKIMKILNVQSEDIVRKTIEDLLKNNPSGIQLNVSVDSDEIRRIVQEILQDALKKYDDKFDDLGKKIRELKESIEKLQKNNPHPINIDLSSLESKFDELKNEVLQEMYGKIDEVRNQMTKKINQDIMPKLSQLDNNVRSLATQVKDLSSGVNDLRSEVQKYAQQVQALRGLNLDDTFSKKVGEIISQVDQIFKQELGKLEKELGKELGKVKESVENLDRKIIDGLYNTTPRQPVQTPPQPTQSPAPVPTNGIALKFPGVEFTHEELEILKRFVIGGEWSDDLPNIVEKVKRLNESQVAVLVDRIRISSEKLRMALRHF